MFDATALAEKAGNAIAANIVMLGSLIASGILPISEEEILTSMKESIPPRFLELNMKALKLGGEAFRAQGCLEIH